MSPRISVIVPCLDEEGAVGETLAALSRVLEPAIDYELVVVDDGSTDSTKRILRDLAAQDPKLRLVEHERNLGYGAALKSGLRRAKGDFVAIIDADGTYPVERFPELIEKCFDHDMVVGARIGAGASHPKMRSYAKFWLQRWVSWVAREPVPDINSGMRVFRRNVAERYLGILPDGFSFTITITLALLTNHYSVCFEPIAYAPRVGRSKIRPIHDTLRFMSIIVRTGMYFAPLRVLAPVIAFLFGLFLLSFGYDVFVLENLTDKTVLLFLSAVNTAMLGLLADMIDKRTTRQ